jgi:hypothetical protein
MPNQDITLYPGDTLTVTCAAAAGAPPPANAAIGGKRNRKAVNKTRKAQAGGKKRGPNPFMNFAKEQRPAIMKEHPDWGIPEVGKELGRRWRAKKGE